jgi:hypothetical protein
LPWDLATWVCRLDLRPPSVWRTFLAVLLTARRYGGCDAYLSGEDLAQMTGLSLRAVKAALAALTGSGVLMRPAARRHLRVNLPVTAVVDAPGRMQGARSSAPQGCKLACTFPTSLASFSSEEDSVGAFTPRQQDVIDDVLAEASELLGHDAGGLLLTDTQLDQLGLPPRTTIGEARATIAAAGDSRQARDFTRAVLALQRDSRVQGEDLPGFAVATTGGEGS